MMVTIDAWIEEDALKESLQLLQAKYAMLQSTIKEYSFSRFFPAEPYFKVLHNPPAINLSASYIEDIEGKNLKKTIVLF